MENYKIVIPKKLLQSLTRDSRCRALTGPNFGVLHLWSLMGGGRLRELVAHGNSTVIRPHPILENGELILVTQFQARGKTNINNKFNS